MEPFTISSGTETERRIPILEVEGVDGFIGWGECVAMAYPNYNAESIDTCWLALTEWILPDVLSRSFAHPGEVYPYLRKKMRGHEMARASIEMALWDLWAMRQHTPLSRVLGGTRSEIATGISIGIQTSPGILADKVAGYLAEGYRKIKIKIKPGFDVPYVRAVREAHGPDVPIMVDANNAYTLDQIDTFKQLDAFDLMMIEQPLAWDDIIRSMQRYSGPSKRPFVWMNRLRSRNRRKTWYRWVAGVLSTSSPVGWEGFTRRKPYTTIVKIRAFPSGVGG